MRFGFVGPSYTARSTAVADEEAINLFSETAETQGSVAPGKSYGGNIAESLKNFFGTPGLEVFALLPEKPVRGSFLANQRCFVVAGASLYEVKADKTFVNRGAVGSDSIAASIAFNSIQLFIVSRGHGYCYDLATNTLTDQTASLALAPVQVEMADTFFIVIFSGSNKFQFSDPLDGTSWPGLNVNEVSVFPENIVSIAVNHRELWVFGSRHTQPYQDTGSAEVFDVIPGALIEKGNAATFSTCKLDNSLFWIDEDDRGARGAWRSNGYTPQRISTHAVEIDLQSYSTAQIAKLTAYAYQDGGHLFWVLYVPNSSWSWVYDVGESAWHKRAFWIKDNGPYESHHSWNHVYAFGTHLVGDWKSGNLYEMKMPVDHGDGSYSFVTDAGDLIRRLRRAPTVEDERNYLYHKRLTVNFDTGLGPQPPLVDGEGNPRPPQAMLRWSNNRGKTWSNEHWRDCGYAGEYDTPVHWDRLGRSRNRVYELSMTDPIPWVVVDAYLDIE